MRRLLGTFLAVAACALTTPVPTLAQQPPTVTTLRVLAFDGGWNLPIWIAQRNGLFETQGLNVQLAYTPSSGFLVTSLLDGKVDLAFATIDNVIAYQEGQGEAKIGADPDLFAFMGGDGGFFSLVAAPSVNTVADLRGKTVSVDAMTTGLAFVTRELIARGGVGESDVNFVRVGGTALRYRDLLAGKQEATLLRTPFELLAESRGYRKLAAAESLGAYQGSVGLARRSWAREHEAALVGFLRAYRAATDWLYDPANREIAEAVLVANIRDMTPALAKRSYDLLLAPNGGISRDLAPSVEGIRTVLQLRGKYATPQKSLTDPMKYVDLAYYNKAFGKP